MKSLRRLISEIHRRSLWQVLGIYLVGGWVAFEVVQTLTEGLNLPEWFPALAVVLLIIGLPLVMATAFVQEGGPDVGAAAAAADLEGILQEKGEPASRSRNRVQRLFTWRKALLGTFGAFVLLVTVAVSWIGTERGVLTSQLGLGSEPPVDAGEEAPVEKSVAVLPFENMSADPDQQYFSDGVTEQILNALARIPDLKVTARTSAFAFRGSDVDIRTIADSLGVATVLEGSVQRSGDRVRVTAQLVEAESGFHLWSESYDRELTDIFEVQDEVARAITERLRTELTPAEETRIAGFATSDPGAHDAYLRGRQLLYQRTADGIRGAVASFQRALERDPGYAPAHAGLASAYGLGVGFSVPGPDSSYEWLARALAHAERAIELDSLNGEAYAARGWATFLPPLTPESRASAMRSFTKALELQPNSADAWGWYGLLLSVLGRHEESLDAHERAVDLDPVAPGRRLGYAYSALAHRQPELALEQARRARAISPGVVAIAWMYEVIPFVLLDRADECLDFDGIPPAHKALCLHAAGRIGDAESRIDSLESAWTPSDPWLSADGMAAYYAWTGEVENALRWLERGVGGSGYMHVAPGGRLAVFPPGLWDPIMTGHEDRIRSTLERLGNEAWDRIRAERRRAEAP